MNDMEDNESRGVVIRENIEIDGDSIVSGDGVENGGSGGGQEKEIDLIGIAMQLWKERKRICIWCAVGAVLGLIVAFSIPREYTSGVKLAPELGDKGVSNQLGGLAAMAGINFAAETGDAMSPMLYPDIINSVSFQLSLLEMPVVKKDSDKKMTLQEFIENDTKSPWWGVIMGAPRAAIDWLRSLGKDDEDKETVTSDGADGPIIITKEQAGYIEFLENAIQADVDQKTFVISISVTMQDPMVAATVADTVSRRLQEYIIDYRTQKARQDLAYLQKLNDEAKEKYYKAQQRFADYLDSNQGLVLYSARTTRDRLENEATLAFNIFNQTSQKLELAKAKVQEQTPVYATLEPPTVPLIPSKPRKVMILAAFIFLGGVLACSWILFGRPLVEKFRSEGRGMSDNGGL